MTDTAKDEKAAQAQDEPRYTREDWKERSRNFTLEDGRSVSPHAIAAALHDVQPESTFSRAQVQKRLDAVLAKEHTHEVIS